jgi:hypothetical protein
MSVVFRILDNDPERARKTERALRTAMTAHGIEGQVCQVMEYLEFARIGLRRLPALEIGGKLLFEGRELSSGLLNSFCWEMAAALQTLEKRKKEAAVN